MVHYRDSAASGGSLRVGETIANHVDPERIVVEMVFAYGGPGPVAGRRTVPCHFIGGRGPRDFAAWVRARALFRKLQPDVIHFQDGVVWLRSALAATRYLKLTHVHARYASQSQAPRGSNRKHPYLASPLCRAFLKSTQGQVCISNGARQALLDLGSIPAERSYVVYNSIDVSYFDSLPERSHARAKLNLPDDALLVGMICRLVWEKGCQELLSLVERLPKRWHGVICGEGPQRGELEKACAEHGLDDRIHFIGVRDDVRDVYAALDAYAFLSHYEPFGLVLAEAMAARVPVFGIASDGEFNECEYPLLRPGTAEMVQFARAGNYDAEVPAEIINDLATRISRYGEHQPLYAEMVSRARSWVEGCFDARVQAEAMTWIYEDLAGRAAVTQEQLREFYQGRLNVAETTFGATHQPATIAAIA